MLVQLSRKSSLSMKIDLVKSKKAAESVLSLMPEGLVYVVKRGQKIIDELNEFKRRQPRFR